MIVITRREKLLIPPVTGINKKCRPRCESDDGKTLKLTHELYL